MMGDLPETISPPDDALSAVIVEARANYPSLGISKLLTQVKNDHPGWTVSEKRLRKAIQANATSIEAKDRLENPDF